MRVAEIFSLGGGGGDYGHDGQYGRRDYDNGYRHYDSYHGGYRHDRGLISVRVDHILRLNLL